MSKVIPALADINIPPHVKIQVTDSLESLLNEIGRRSMMGYAGEAFFGTAFVQGSRLQFTTAMPMHKMVQVSRADRSRKKDKVPEVSQHSNRPQEPTHAKQVREYLMKTACVGDKFILPAFTFNYGVGLNDDSPDATLMLSGDGSDGANTWPGILLLPPDAKLDTTDGAHRRGQIEEIFESSKVSEEQKTALRRNAVDVKIIFEKSRSDSHQDFADCGKAKAIPKSLVTTFDVRDRRNQRSREMVTNSPFLSAYVDATASNVNLSAKSKMIWSMSAIRMFVAHIVDHHPDQELSEAEKTAGAELFFDALTRHLPQLSKLNMARNSLPSETTTGALREARGGDLALRGIGMALFARAFLYCKVRPFDFDMMAAKLAELDWNLLDCERSSIDTANFRDSIRDHVVPMWANVLVVGEGRYRILSSSVEADETWAVICKNKLEAMAEAA